MESKSFCYWLQGYIEISSKGGGVAGLTSEQVKCIGNHLALVFKHEIDPSEPGDATQNQAIHDGTNSHLFHNQGADGYNVRC